MKPSSIPSTVALPAADRIDYNNVDEVCAYQLLLCKIYEREGGFSSPAANTPAIRELCRQGLIWLREVNRLIDAILSADPAARAAGLPTLAAIPGLLASYDLLYRITNGQPCFDYLRQIKLLTADRWLKRDHTISRSEVALMLLSEVDRDIRTLDPRYTDYAMSLMDTWIDQLTRRGRLLDLTPSETYRCLSYLLRQDLFAYFGTKDQPVVKTQWIKRHLLTSDQLDALDLPTLWSYLTFVDTASRLHLHSAGISSSAALRAALRSRHLRHPDLHSLSRQALTLDLSQPTPSPAKRPARPYAKTITSINQSW